MKTDTLFYRIFNTWPQLLFDLAGIKQSAKGYQFDSIEIKQTAFRIDGFLKPADHQIDQAITFVEVQYQKDEDFYNRFFAEILLYLRHKKPRNAWQAIVLYPRKSIEDQSQEHLYKHLLAMPNVHIIYLNEVVKKLKDAAGLNLLKIIVGSKREAKHYAHVLLQDLPIYSTQYGINSRELLEFIETILIYKFPKMTRKEVLDMLGYNYDELKHTQYYKDVIFEGKALFFKEMLERRFGILPVSLQSQLEQATEKQLQEWSQRFFNAQQLSDVFGEKQKH